MDVKIVASKVVGQMANAAVPFSGPIAESLVQELLGAQDEQVKLLRTVSDQLDRLLNGPWETARMFLREAAQPGRRPGQVATALLRASLQLHEAVPLQEARSLPRAQALTDLAMVERIRGELDFARHYALAAYRTGRAAMGDLVQREYRRKPDRPDHIARLNHAGALYDDIEWTAAVLADSRAPAMLSLTATGLAVRFPYQGLDPVEWAANEALDFAYIAYFNYLRQVIRAVEARATKPLMFTSLDILWFRFSNPPQVEHPEYRALPPMAELESAGESTGKFLLRDLMSLAAMGKLP